MRNVLVILSLMALPAHADVTGPSGRTVDCFCTDTQGSRVELGEVICLYVDGRAFMAQCDMSLNVPIWRDIGEACISSDLPQSKPHFLQPAIQSLAPPPRT